MYLWRLKRASQDLIAAMTDYTEKIRQKDIALKLKKNAINANEK